MPIQKWFCQPAVKHPADILNFHLFGVYFGTDLPMTYAALLITIGALLIVVGWITLYRGTKDDPLVTHGIYALSATHSTLALSWLPPAGSSPARR